MRDLSLDELEQAVNSAPDDYLLRGRLVEMFLKSNRSSEACDHFSVISHALPGVSWVLRLGIATATAAGDHLMAARYRRQLRESPGELGPDWESSSHPSHSPDEVQLPRLRLVSGSGSEAPTLKNARRTLHDIAGLATVKANLTDIVDQVTNASVPSNGPWLGGALMYGPPNCGKAFSAEVVAGELNASFTAFDLSETWAPNKLRERIDDVIAAEADRPSILYFENLDAPNATTLMRPLLTDLDSARSHHRAVLLGGAIYPWQVSPEIVRSGRLGRVLLLLPPDAPSRRTFLVERFTGRAAIAASEIDWLVEHTDGHSFGDLERLVDVACAIAVAAEEADTVGSLPTVTHPAVRSGRQQVSSSSAEWLSTAGHHAIMNESGGMYDDLLTYFHTRQKH